MLQRLPSATVFKKLAVLAGVQPSDANVLVLEQWLIPLVDAIAEAYAVAKARETILARIKALRAAQANMDATMLHLREAAADFLTATHGVVAANDQLAEVLMRGLMISADYQPAEVKQLQLALKDAAPPTVASARFTAQFEFLSELAAAPLETASRGRRERPSAGRGRPAGSQTHRAFRSFVMLLLSAVQEVGGALTFAEEYPEAGTLWPALQLFAPLLPRGVIPLADVIPAKKWPSRLRRTHAAWRRSCLAKNSTAAVPR